MRCVFARSPHLRHSRALSRLSRGGKRCRVWERRRVFWTQSLERNLPSKNRQHRPCVLLKAIAHPNRHSPWPWIAGTRPAMTFLSFINELSNSRPTYGKSFSLVGLTATARFLNFLGQTWAKAGVSGHRRMSKWLEISADLRYDDICSGMLKNIWKNTNSLIYIIKNKRSLKKYMECSFLE